MTVAELIKELSQYDPDTHVFLTFAGDDYDCVGTELPYPDTDLKVISIISEYEVDHDGKRIN
jgi:hypothetical protein